MKIMKIQNIEPVIKFVTGGPVVPSDIVHRANTDSCLGFKAHRLPVKVFNLTSAQPSSPFLVRYNSLSYWIAEFDFYKSRSN